MQALLEEYQVIDLTGPPYYPPYNGKLERANRGVKGYVRARLLASARSRSEKRSARRRAIEQVLLRYSLMKESGDV